MKGATERFPLKLRTVLLLLTGVILALPVMGIYRIYQTELARQTEVELYAQAAFVAAIYRHELERELVRQRTAGNPIDFKRWAAREGYRPVEARRSEDLDESSKLNPVPLTVDLSQPMLPVPTYVTNEKGPVDLLAETVAARITHLIKEVQLTTLASVRVLDQWGRVVGSTGGSLGLYSDAMPEADAALAGHPKCVVRSRTQTPLPVGLLSASLTTVARAGERTVYVGYPIVKDGYVIAAAVLGRTPRNVLKALYYKRERLFVTIFIILTVAVLLATLASAAVTHPVRALVRQAERVARADPEGSMPIARPGTVEIAQLSAALASTARTLEQRGNYIREFARNVSHEFKTPLAGIRGAVELLQDHLAVMTDEERGRFLDNIAVDVERLERLSRSLLELARADVLVPGKETVVLRELIEELARRYASRGLALKIAGDALDARLPMQREVADSVLSNLLDNSRRHGATEVRLEASSPRARKLEILVADNGPGIPESNRDSVFRPFFTTSRDHEGTGLGLAIAKAYLQRHGGDIRLLPSDDGATFRISLPAA